MILEVGGVIDVYCAIQVPHGLEQVVFQLVSHQGIIPVQSNTYLR